MSQVGTLSKSEATSSQATLRDPDYYYPDGDCVVRVENTCFKVHKAFLARDQSFFVDTFSLPSGPQSVPSGKCTDEDPLVLHDTVEEFRALCWILYALPLQIQEEYGDNADLPRMMSLAVITHKYGFVSLEKWSHTVLLHHCERISDSNILATCCDLEMEILAGIAELGKVDKLRQLVQAGWLSRLKDGTLSPKHAICVGENHSWRDFLGKAYYQELRKLRLAHLNESDAHSVNVDEASDLTENQKYHLFRGFYSLSAFWDAFVKKRAQIDANFVCAGIGYQTHRDCCAGNIHKVWTHLFADLLVAYRSGVVEGDVLGNLMFLKERMSTAPSWGQILCRHALVHRIQLLHDELVELLADHFLGRPSS